MEQSAFEALMIGVYVFVFITALTAGVLLMSNVIDMVNYANDQAIVGMNGTLAETVGVVNERVYTGAQLVTYYREQEERETLEKEESKYTFNVTLGQGQAERSLKNFIEQNSALEFLNEKFVLTYEGEKDGKELYIFVRYQEESEER